MTQLMAPMDCRQFRKHHLAYLDDTLSGDQMMLAQRHILACDTCAAHDTLVRRSLMIARSMPTIEPSSAFQERLQARLAQCRQERMTQQEADAEAWEEGVDGSVFSAPHMPRPLWRSPKAFAAIAASAVVGTLMWRGFAPAPAPVVSMQPVIASVPAHPGAQYISPALLQAMATGNPVWPATVIIEEAPTNFVNVDYSMLIDGR
jgi:hypothetical protein